MRTHLAAFAIVLLSAGACLPDKSEIEGCYGKGTPQEGSAACKGNLMLFCQTLDACCTTHPGSCNFDGGSSSGDGGFSVNHCLDFSRGLGLDCTAPSFAQRRTCTATTQACAKQVVESDCTAILGKGPVQPGACSDFWTPFLSNTP